MKWWSWFKARVSHKLEHLRWVNIKKLLKEHGLALVVIVVGWEIIEDIVFPLIFARERLTKIPSKDPLNHKNPSLVDFYIGNSCTGKNRF